MNLPTVSDRYAQWRSSLPLAKNTVGKPAAGMANLPNLVNVPVKVKERLYSGEIVETSTQSFDPNVMMCEAVPSSKRDYTAADAEEYQYLRQFTIKLDDLIAGNYDAVRLPVLGQPVSQEFIDGLRQNGIPDQGYDTARAGFYLMGLSDTAGFSHSVDYLASGYAVMKRRIEGGVSGGRQAELLEQLDAKFNSAVEKVASRAAEELGGFFEANGVAGETDKIHDSVVRAYQDSVNKYDGYICQNQNYAKLDGTQDQWLEQDDSYMACQLRKAAGAGDAVPSKAGEEGYYSPEDLDKTMTMANEAETYISGNDAGKTVSCWNDEEQVGYKLAEITLEGDVFCQYSGVADGLKDAVSKAIENFVNSAAEKLNKRLEKERAQVAEPDKLADFDSSAIFAVYNKVMQAYQTTKNLMKALTDGAAFAEEQHKSRIRDPKISNLVRYGETGSNFWNNFFRNTVKYKGTDSYVNRECGIETLAKNWNGFVMQVTDGEDVMLSLNGLSVYA